MFFNSTPSVSVDEAFNLSSQQGSVLIDVRSPSEYQSGHARGALNYPLENLSAKVSDLRRYDAVYVICQSGGRSALATKTLIASAIKAVNISGGTSTWISKGLPLS